MQTRTNLLATMSPELCGVTNFARSSPLKIITASRFHSMFRCCEHGCSRMDCIVQYKLEQ